MGIVVPPTLDISDPQIVIVAAGDSTSAQANARGHLFERFIAQVFSAYGCEEPKTESLNVKSNGYELDISTRIKLTAERVLAECKAYSAPLHVQALSSFFGKLSTERLDEAVVHGWFVAIPGLTSDGQALADRLEAKDKRLHVLNAKKIYGFVIESGWIDSISAGEMYLSDHGILIAPSGLYAIAKQLDRSSRLPTTILVFRKTAASESEMDLFRSTDYVSGLPILDMGASLDDKFAPQKLEAATLVSVIGSSADFEYQFPAAPQFFVGRDNILEDVISRLNSAQKSGGVLVLNAQSGWGKSSLALKIAALATERGGVSIVFDSRTASAPHYVAASLQAAMSRAEAAGVLTLPSNASFGSLQSSVKTVQAAEWHAPLRPVVVFYDQFENVFRDERTTQEFRDLALMVREVNAPLTIGFSWKTDLVALTENYPYRLRDEIRGGASVVNIEPFGPKEVGVVLNRLATEARTNLSKDLRERIREYSQGLPWLLKKLASHILSELRAGRTEEELLEEALNIEGLFEQDLAPLQTTEEEALKLVAREAPVSVADLVERVEPSVIQSLVDQRLLVRVGEKLDTYWDTFREFLITGKVAIEDTFILRQRPRATSKVLAALIDAGGEISSGDVATKLSTSLNVVFNVARDLRQLNILAPRTGTIVFVDSLRNANVTEADLQARVAKSLRRHRVFKVVNELIDASPSGRVSIDELAFALPAVYPALAARQKTWKMYALAFAHWLEYAGLTSLTGLTIGRSSGWPSQVKLIGSSSRRGRRRTFPQSRPQAAISYLRQIQDPDAPNKLSKSTIAKIVSDLSVLSVLDENGKIRDGAFARSLTNSDEVAAILLQLLKATPGGPQALDLLIKFPNASAMDVGLLLKDAYGMYWMDVTTRMAGGKFRSWAAEAGLKLRSPARHNGGKVGH